MNELALFAGAGGGLLGSALLGHTPVCAVEIEPYCREVLLRRQRDGVLPMFPIWDDVRTFDGKPWRGIVDVVSAGFPCQPFSVAGARKADQDERNLWPDTARIIGEVRPRYALLENVPGLVAHSYFGTVIGDLASLGYDAEWCVLGAGDMGAPHERARAWILAYAERNESQISWSWGSRRMGRISKPISWDEGCEQALAYARRMDDGLAREVERTNATRNGQVPAVVEAAWEILMARAAGSGEGRP